MYLNCEGVDKKVIILLFIELYYGSSTIKSYCTASETNLKQIYPALPIVYPYGGAYKVINNHNNYFLFYLLIY